MANGTTLLKYSLKTNIVKSIFFEIISKVSRYYYTFGRSSAWPTVTAIDNQNQVYTVSSEEDPPAVSDSYPYELETRRNMVYSKYVDSNDVAVVVNRVNWQPGTVYDMYDDYTSDSPSYTGATSTDTALFYVITDEYNVYKCLFNNNDSASTSKPVSSSTEAVLMDDGYIWKFMYTVPLYLRNKFLTTSYMPVLTALTNQFYSNGSITGFAIENRGSKYIKALWKVKRVTVLSGGINYTGSTITFDAPPTGGVRATGTITSYDSNGGIATISITNQGSGYTSQPIFTVTSPLGTARGFDYIIEYERDTANGYTEIQITGDGYSELNPYSLKKINILNRGTFDTQPSGDLFIFPPPAKSYGRRPTITITFRNKAAPNASKYEVDTVTIVDGGYGYTEKLLFSGSTVGTANVISTVLSTGGFTCNFDEASQKNEAELLPLINASGEIEAITIASPGIGYTYASVKVVCKKRLVPGNLASPLITITTANASDPDIGLTGFLDASILLNFGIGDIETKQSNVELLAVDGSIPVIKVDFGGNGYPAFNKVIDNNGNVTYTGTRLTVIGDGSGCTAEPVIVSGKITKVIVTNPGQNYTNATIVVNIGDGPDQSGLSQASLRAIISPKGGHGKDAIGELYAKTIMLQTRLVKEENKGVPITNDFRQVAIVKNPKEYSSDSFFRKAVGSSCLVLTCEVTPTNTATFSLLTKDDVLYLSSDSAKTFTLIEKTQIGNKYYLVAQINNNFKQLPSQGATLYKTVGSSTASISVTSVEVPDFNKYSGELLYIDNRVKFVSSEDQTVAVSTLISF
jgi:hypothetical protein